MAFPDTLGAYGAFLNLPEGHGGQTYDPDVFRFWPRELRKSGYHTALIGKWHLGEDTGHGREWDHSVVWNQNNIRGDWYNEQPISIDGGPKKVMLEYSTDLYDADAMEQFAELLKLLLEYAVGQPDQSLDQLFGFLDQKQAPSGTHRALKKEGLRRLTNIKRRRRAIARGGTSSEESQ